MIKRSLSILGLLILTACSDVYSWRQKLTVTVLTPDGPVVAMSVTEVTYTETDGFLVFHEARGVRSRISGEAVVLEVAPDRYLFVMLDGVEKLALKTFEQLPYTYELGFKQWARSLQRYREVVAVPQENYPQMVTFDDINTPTSVRLVDPTNLSDVFGAGYVLEGMTLQIVKEPVTQGKVESVLNWLYQIWPYTLDGRRIETIEAENRLANSLSANSFSTEISN